MLRGLALFGVAAVNNETEFRVSLYQQFIAFSNADGLDGAVERFVAFFLEWKAVSLFSILFGLGLAMQFERLSRGDSAYSFLVDASWSCWRSASSISFSFGMVTF